MNKADFDQLLNDEVGLSEQFKIGASQIFESAVNEAIGDNKAKLTKLQERLDETRKALCKTSRRQKYTAKLFESLRASSNDLKAQLATALEDLAATTTEKQKLQEQLESQAAAEDTEGTLEFVQSLQEENTDLRARIETLSGRIESLESEKTSLEENIERSVAEQVADNLEELTERLATYVDFVAEQYVNEHADEITEQSKVIVSEGILESIRNVFARYGFEPIEHTSAIEEELEATKAELEEAYNRLAESLDSKQEALRELEEQKKVAKFSELTRDLSESAREKVRRIVESADYPIDDFENRVEMLVESFKPAVKAEKVSNSIVSEIVPLTESKVEDRSEQETKVAQPEIDPEVAFLAKAIRRLK